MLARKKIRSQVDLIEREWFEWKDVNGRKVERKSENRSYS